jgi:hypothetical protein
VGLAWDCFGPGFVPKLSQNVTSSEDTFGKKATAQLAWNNASESLGLIGRRVSARFIEAHRHVRWASVRDLLTGGNAGVPVGAYCLAHMLAEALRVVKLRREITKLRTASWEWRRVRAERWLECGVGQSVELKRLRLNRTRTLVSSCWAMSCRKSITVSTMALTTCCAE